MLLTYLSVIAAFGGIFLLFYSHPQWRPTIDGFFRGHYRRLLLVLIGLLVLLMLLVAANQEFNMDELEHLHSAWYLQHQQLPYRDFFQHHHPLLWVLMAPIIALLGHSARLLLVFRLLMVLVTLGSGYLVYRIGQKAVDSRETGLLSVILLFSTVMFVQYTVQIRPDVVQIFFSLLSVYYLVCFFHTPAHRYMVFGGLAAALSFLFLQKAIFFLVPFGLMMLFFYFKRQIPFTSLLIFTSASLIPVLLFLLYLVLTGSWPDYFLTNWRLNIAFAAGDTFTLWKYLNRFILKDIVFWLLTALSLGFVWKGRKRREAQSNRVAVAAAFIGLFLFLSLLVYRRPHGHYFMFAIALLSIPAGYLLAHILNRWRLKETYKVAALLLLLITPCFFILRVTVNRNARQLQRAQYVLDHSRPDDLVYDGDNIFNLFRWDLHYFWYSVKPRRGLETYNRLTANKYGDYDICRLIKKKKPRFISDFHLDIDACGLTKLYKPTPFPHLYIRLEN
jgi:hypothetical protein